MSRRPGFVVDHRVPADGGKPPNQYRDLISVQVRCNWPLLSSRTQVIEALGQAMGKALAEVVQPSSDTPMVDAMEAIPGRLRAEMKRRGLSYRTVADELGMTVSALHGAAMGERDIRMSTALAVVKWLEQP